MDRLQFAILLSRYQGTSYLNRTEAAAVEKVVTRLLQNGMSTSQVGSGIKNSCT